MKDNYGKLYQVLKDYHEKAATITNARGDKNFAKNTYLIIEQFNKDINQEFNIVQTDTRYSGPNPAIPPHLGTSGPVPPSTFRAPIPMATSTSGPPGALPPGAFGAPSPIATSTYGSFGAHPSGAFGGPSPMATSAFGPPGGLPSGGGALSSYAYFPSR